MNLRLRLLQQTLDQEWSNEPRATRQQHLVHHRIFRQRLRRLGRERELRVIAHHLLLSRMLLIAERRQRMPQQLNRLFRSTLQLFRKLEQFSHAHPLDDPNIDLPRQQLRSLILQQFLELVHEHDQVQRIQSRFHQVVRFIARQVIARLQHIERRLNLTTRLT